MRSSIVGLCMVVGVWGPATAQVSIGVGIGMPGVSIGINLPVYPALVPVPGYPVYYAPQSDSNYFFYDGAYWVYQDDNWYASDWYNGPWSLVDIQAVPLFILRIPVRYYRRPPPYFGGWRADAAPRWGERWGRDWEQQHRGWDRWDRSAAPRPAPLPTYQRQYSGSRYPDPQQQRALQSQNYRYQPHGVGVPASPAAGSRRGEPPSTDPHEQQARQQMQPAAVNRGGGGPAPAGPANRRVEQPSSDPHEQQARQMMQPAPQQRAQPVRPPAPSTDVHEQQSRQQMQPAQPQRGEDRGRERGEERGREGGRDK